MDLTLRVDATREVGAGHFMRSVRLAEAWRSTGFGEIRWCGDVDLPFALAHLDRIGAQRGSPNDADEALGVLIVDSYRQDARDVLSRSPARLRVLVDDLGDPCPPGVNVVWNPNPYGRAEWYPRPAVVLAGPEYVPIRDGLPRWTPAGRAGTAVTIGASAIGDEIRGFLAPCLEAPDLSPIVSAGAAQPPSGWLTADPRAPWDRLVACAHALVGAGVTAWEAAAIGIPTVLLCVVANQRLALAWARERGVTTLDLTYPGRVNSADVRAAIRSATPLPMLRDGSRSVAERLRTLAAEVA